MSHYCKSRNVIVIGTRDGYCPFCDKPILNNGSDRTDTDDDDTDEMEEDND
jgi:hypothetical protein